MVKNGHILDFQVSEIVSLTCFSWGGVRGEFFKGLGQELEKGGP